MASWAEGKIEKYLVRRVHEAGGNCHKLTDQRGVPDRIVVWPDRPAVYVEVKTPAGRLSKLQEHYLERLGDGEFPCWVVRSVRDVEDLLQECAAWG